MDKAVEQKLLTHAWQYGHFRNPAFPGTHEVKHYDYRMLSADDTLARDAIASVQMSDSNCDRLCHLHHGRGLIADGDAGPATIAYLDVRRCQVPDFATEGDEFGLSGTGGWLKCDDTREHDHEVVIKFDDRQAPSRWQGYMDEVKQGAVDISADVGLSVRYVDWNSVEDYQSSVEFKRIPGNVIGYYYLPQGSGCRRVPQGALDTSYQPDVEMASLLWIHEGLGHGIALQHTNGGIMNPSLIRSPMSWRNDPSWRAIERLYGGEPLDPPAPDPPPTPDKPDVVFTYTAKKSGEKISLVTGTTDGGGGWEF